MMLQQYYKITGSVGYQHPIPLPTKVQLDFPPLPAATVAGTALPDRPLLVVHRQLQHSYSPRFADAPMLLVHAAVLVGSDMVVPQVPSAGVE